MGTGGLLVGLRRLLGGGLEWTELRLALFANGLELEKLRLLESLLWLAAALVAATAGVLLLAALLVLLAGDAWRLPVLAGLTLACLGGAGLAWRQAVSRAQGGEPPFAALRDELARDRAAFGPGADNGGSV